jgi:hypothetical protein
MEAQASIATQLQRVVNVCTLEATEYEVRGLIQQAEGRECMHTSAHPGHHLTAPLLCCCSPAVQRAQRLGLLQPALDAMAQSAYQQQQQQQQQAGGVTSATPQGRANVLHRPLAAATHAADQDASGTPADAAAGAGAPKAGAQPTPATAGMLPTPLLMTPAGAALLQTPATGWGVSAAGTGVRPVAGFPHHFLHGMMGGTPLMHQHARPMQQHIETDDGKLSKKRQGYHIEPAALRQLIEKQQLEAQRKQEQELQAVAAASARVSQAAAEAEAAAAAVAAAAAAAAAVSAPPTAAGSNPPDEPPPRQPQQQHRPRVMSRLPPQVQEQAERQAAERARKAAEQKEQEEADAAAAAAAADVTASSRVAHSVRAVGGGGVFAQGGRQQGAPMTAADCLESPNNGSLGGLRLPVGPELDPQGHEGLSMGLENSKLFGSAQKRLRLSLCDEHGSLMPGGQPLISPVVLPTPSPAVHAATPAPVPGLAGRGGAGAGAGAADGSSSAAAGTAAACGAGAGAGGSGQQAAAVGTSQEAPTPSKFFTGSPVPQTERRALGHAEPETPMALLTGQAPARKADVQEALMDPLRGGAQAHKAEGGAAAGQAEGGAGSGSGWVPVPGQAPAVLGATPAPPAPPAAGADGDDMELDPAAAAAMPLPESPVKQVTAVGAAQAGGSGGGESGGMVLQTPEGQEQAVAATPATGM